MTIAVIDCLTERDRRDTSGGITTGYVVEPVNRANPRDGASSISNPVGIAACPPNRNALTSQRVRTSVV